MADFRQIRPHSSPESDLPTPTEANELFQGPRRRSAAPVVALVVLVLAILGGGAAYWYLRLRPSPPAPAPVAAAAPAPEAVPNANLAEGEALLRKLGAQLSSSPDFQNWLAENDLLRRIVAAVNLMSDGKSPRAVLGFMVPKGEFQAQGPETDLQATAASAARYDLIARVITAIDVKAAAGAFGQLKPYLDAGYAEIGPPGSTFESALSGAIDLLVKTPLPPQSPRLLLKGALYVYADPALEGLAPAQKNLLRMGSKNAQAVQTWLKALSSQLALPAPAPAK